MGAKAQPQPADRPATPRPGAHRPTRIFLTVLLTLVVLLLASMVADRVLPVADRLLAGAGLRLDRPTRLALPPNLDTVRDDFEFRYTIRTNRRGLRAPDVAPVASPETRRIVFLGDGQTFGVGVEAEQTFAALLETQLAGVQTVNCGRPHAHTLAQARILYHLGLRYSPELVVMCVSADDLADMPPAEIKDPYELKAPPRTLGGALWPNLTAARRAAKQREKYTAAREPYDFTADVEQKAVNKKIADSAIQVWKRAAGRHADLIEAAGRRRFDGNVMAFGLLWPLCWPDRLDLAANWTEKRWRRLRRALDLVAAETSHADIRLAVAFIPAGVQYDPQRHEWLRGLGYRMARSTLTETSRFQIALGRWCGDQGIRFLDLTPAFRSHAAPAGLRFTYGDQLTAEGHKLIVSELRPWLQACLTP